MSLTCGRNLSQSWRGQSISTVARAATKSYLKVPLTHLAALMQWLCGGTNCIFILFFFMCFSTALEHLLSMTSSTRWYWCACRMWKTSVKVTMKDALVRFGIGQTMMVLRS